MNEIADVNSGGAGVVLTLVPDQLSRLFSIFWRTKFDDRQFPHPDHMRTQVRRVDEDTVRVPVTHAQFLYLQDFLDNRLTAEERSAGTWDWLDSALEESYPRRVRMEFSIERFYQFEIDLLDLPSEIDSQCEHDVWGWCRDHAPDIVFDDNQEDGALNILSYEAV